jgi:hypothetical protein
LLAAEGWLVMRFWEHTPLDVITHDVATRLTERHQVCSTRLSRARR